MPITQLLSPANILNAYPAQVNSVYCARDQRDGCWDVGHIFLDTPQPGDFWPVVDGVRLVRLDLQPMIVQRTPLVLSNVFVQAGYRGKGIGQKLVLQSLKYADQQGVPVVLRARPYRTRRMTVMALCEWYAKLGFTYMGMHDDNHYMARRTPTQ